MDSYLDLVHDVRMIILHDLYKDNSYDSIVCLGLTNKLLYEDLLLLNNNKSPGKIDLLKALVKQGNKTMTIFFIEECGIKPKDVFLSAIAQSVTSYRDYSAPLLTNKPNSVLSLKSLVEVEVYGYCEMVLIVDIIESIAQSDNYEIFNTYGQSFTYEILNRMLREIARYDSVSLYEKLHSLVDCSEGYYGFFRAITHPQSRLHRVRFITFLEYVYQYKATRILKFICNHTTNRHLQSDIVCHELIKILLDNHLSGDVLLEIVGDFCTEDTLRECYNDAVKKDNLVVANKAKELLQRR